ncbi:MAG: hypothetical protein MUE81_00065 [Thermoflexibacter sp.]|jgi:hypothetical protein|nr:hypothetical protein [Thermoflexibacter sp.]
MDTDCFKLTHYFRLLAFIFISLAMLSCAKNIEKEQDVLANTTFEQFLELFPPKTAIIESIDTNNGADFQGGAEINVAYFQEFLQNNVFIDQDLKKVSFNRNVGDNQFLTCHSAFSIPLSPDFYSVVISVDAEGDPTQKWKYYLLNYGKDGKYIDGILLSYRNSYESEESTQNIQQSEYRYVRFVSKNDLHFIDINYDNTFAQSHTFTQESPFILTTSGENDTRYYRESWYQIQKNGTFKQIKRIDKDKKEAQP